MLIAQKLRRENIAEYILYLWQLEDLLRALQFDNNEIRKQLVVPAGLSNASADNLAAWYESIAALLREEGKTEVGHLNHTLHLIAELQNFHADLLKSPAGTQYRLLWERLADGLPKLRLAMGAGEMMGDMEVCFRALYATMLYRMKHDNTKESSITDVMELISPLVGELARLFGLAERGEVDIWEE